MLCLLSCVSGLWFVVYRNACQSVKFKLEHEFYVSPTLHALHGVPQPGSSSAQFCATKRWRCLSKCAQLRSRIGCLSDSILRLSVDFWAPGATIQIRTSLKRCSVSEMVEERRRDAWQLAFQLRSSKNSHDDCPPCSASFSLEAHVSVPECSPHASKFKIGHVPCGKSHRVLILHHGFLQDGS